MSSRHQKNVESSDESFGGFDEEDNVSAMEVDSDEESVDVKVGTAVLDDKDSDEEDLERFVLGNKASFRDQLFRDDFLDLDSTALVKSSGQDVAQSVTGKEHLDDASLFVFDTGKSETPVAALQETTEEAQGDQPAWEDSDDERLTVSLANASRLRKLRTTEAEDVVTGTEYARRLRQQYLRLYPLPAWAKDASAAKPRRRRSSASQGDSSDSDSDAEDLDSALPLDAFLRDANSFVASNPHKRRKLRPETIDIQRGPNIPDIHKSAVTSLSFHPQHPIVLSASASSVMYLHHYDPKAFPTPNPALTSVQVKSTDLRRTAFLGPNGDEIVFAGRRRYFHSWNLSTGAVRRISQIQGHQKEQKTMEYFRLSPCGRYMALVSSSRKGGGMLNILSVATMQWIAQARPNGRKGVADFAWWSDGNGLTIAGRDGNVTEWSMETQRTVGVWRDEGSVEGTVLAMGGKGGPKELGGDRWVAVGNTSGIMNVYDRNNLIREDGEVVEIPTPARAFEQLTTAITVLTFSGDGQLLAFGSMYKKDALRLVHLPSCTVYRNWPTEQTPLGRVTAVAFGMGSDVLAVGNDKGKIRVWDVRG